MSADAAHWIRVLDLAPHPEGGHFRETWRADERTAGPVAPSGAATTRSIGSAIYYLLAAGERSRLHRLRADEVWHLYDGGPLHLHVFDAGGAYRRLALGRDAARGEAPQAVVPRGAWFGAEPAEGAAFALVGCTCAPGFEYEDFELGGRDALLARFPAQRALVVRFTETGED